MTAIARTAGFCAFAFLFLVLGSCASQKSRHDDGLALMAQGQYEEGIAQLEQEIKRDPGNFKHRTDLINARERALNRLLAEAADERAGGGLDGAVRLYGRVLRIDPTSARARSGLAEVERDRAHADSVAQARKLVDDGDIEAASLRIQSVLREDPGHQQALALRRKIEEQRARELASIPTLHSMYDGPPLTMKFRDADLRQVFDVLSRESGVTVVFDRDVRPNLRATIVARQIAFEDAFDLLLMSNQLEKKIINRNTVLIYPVTAEKLRQYQDLSVKGFYLTYADVKQTAELLKAVLKPTEMFVDDKMNMIVLRDTPEAIAIAEKLIAMHDLVAPEVMLDLEVLEVQHNKLEEMGIQWPNQLTLSPLPSNGQTTTLRDITSITSATTGAQLASMIINLRKETGVANLLANPRVRSLNHQKAKYPDRQQGAGRDHYGHRDRVRLAKRAIPRRRPQARSGTVDPPAGRSGNPDRAGGVQHHQPDPDRGGADLPDRYAQCLHRPAHAGRRDPGAGRPDQRPGHADGERHTGAGRHSRRGPPVQEPEG